MVEQNGGEWNNVCFPLIHFDNFELGFPLEFHKNATALGGRGQKSFKSIFNAFPYVMYA